MKIYKSIATLKREIFIDNFVQHYKSEASGPVQFEEVPIFKTEKEETDFLSKKRLTFEEMYEMITKRISKLLIPGFEEQYRAILRTKIQKGKKQKLLDFLLFLDDLENDEELEPDPV